MSKAIEYTINREAASELFNIGTGAFYPLKGFMNSKDYRGVLDEMHLADGAPWTIPITLDIPEERAGDFTKAEEVILKNASGKPLAMLGINDVYRVDISRDIEKVFATGDKRHPGIQKELSRGPYRVGGDIDILEYEANPFERYTLTPEEAKRAFADRGWKRVAGFQTRNPIHRAHEYLQRIAMEITDGVFIQPLVGWKKANDFSSLAIMKSYEKMLEEFYSREKAVLGTLITPMRYAGPREAIFHAIIRRNYGCTHFIVGRDHAGVGGYYGKYDAHRLCSRFNDLGIEILKLHGPFYCRKCGGIVTEKTCSHGDGYAFPISGTYIREEFFSRRRPAEEYMRKEISEILLELGRDNALFSKGDSNEF